MGQRMKNIITFIACVLVASGSFSQGVTKHGESAITGAEFVDEHGRVVGEPALDKHGNIIPHANSNVKLFINGIRISNDAYSVSGSTVTYYPENNGSFDLTDGDRIQFDYFF